MLTFLQSAGIVFREGLEASLIVCAIAAYLRAQNARQFLPALLLGALLAALALGLVAATLGSANIAGTNETLQGIVLLFAAFVMLYVSGWLFARRSGAYWRDFVQQQTQQAFARRAGYVFAAVAFVAVFREGAEVAIFLQAVAIKNQGWQWQMLAGIAAAVAALNILMILSFKLSYRLPLRPIFLITSGLFFLTGMSLLGDALASFQVQKLIPNTPIGTAWASVEALGLNGSYEALIVQLLLLALAALGVMSAISTRAPIADREVP